VANSGCGLVEIAGMAILSEWLVLFAGLNTSFFSSLAVFRHRRRQSLQQYFLLFSLSLLGYIACQIGFLWPDLVRASSSADGGFWFPPHLLEIFSYLCLCTAAIHWLLISAVFHKRAAITSWSFQAFLYLLAVLITATTIAASFSDPDFSQRDEAFKAIWIKNLGGFFVLFLLCWALILSLPSMSRKQWHGTKKQAVIIAISSLMLLIGFSLDFSSTYLQKPGNFISHPFLFVGIISTLFFASAFLQKASLQISPEILHKVFDSIKDTIVVLDKHQNVLYLNRPARDLFPGIRPGDRIHSLAPDIAELLAATPEGDSSDIEFEKELKNARHLVHLTALRSRDKLKGYIILLSNLTRTKCAEEQLVHDAYHDRLSGLPNRNFFINKLNQNIARTKCDQNEQFAVLLLDLDQFKVINDSLGHNAGDQLLFQIAHRLRSCLRTTDTVARLGGDEFVILLENVRGLPSVTEIAQRLQEALSEPILLSDQQLFTSASMGIALAGFEYDRAEDILRDADTAMNQAKQLGKSRYVFFNKEMHRRVSTRLKLEIELRRAIQEQEFELHYQPIVRLSDRRIFGFEALLRWRHPIRGLLLPAEFLPQAMESDLILPIGKWVIKQALEDLAIWQTKFATSPALMMSVNLSRRQLLDKGLIAYILEMLQKTGVPATSLAIEITEDVIVLEESQVLDNLYHLRELGVQLHLDDFGTGYASLNVLPTYPIDTIKIDRSFIGRIPINETDVEIVRTIVNLGSNLKKLVIAEGIETSEAYTQLQSIGCNWGQGYYFYKPLIYNDIYSLLQEIKGGEEILH
jgi:diguanylate cyclase (GGDEF)-like protein